MRHIFQCLFAFMISYSSLYAQDVDSLANPEFYTTKKKAMKMYYQNDSYHCLMYTDEMMEIANGDSLLISISHYIKGTAYNQVRDYENSYIHLLHALNYFSRANNLNYLAPVYASLAELRIQRNDPRGGMDYFVKAFEVYRELGKKKQMYKVKGNMGIVYGQQGNYDKAISTFKEVKELAAGDGDTISMIPAYLNIGQAFLRKGETDSARSYLEMAVEWSDQQKEAMMKADGLNSLSSYYFRQGDFNISIQLCNEVLDIYQAHGAMAGSVNVLERLSSAYAELGQYQKSHEVLWNYIALKDSLFNEQREKAIAAVEGKFLLAEKDNNIRLLEAQGKADKQQKLLYLSLFALALAVTVTVVIKLRNVRKLREVERKLHTNELKMETAQKEQLKNELELKMRSLTREGLRIIQKNQQLESLQLKLDAFGTKIPSHNGNEFGDILSSIKYTFSIDKDWEEFSVYFEEVHPAFLKELDSISPKLTTKEKRLCALMKVNMTTKEIASVLGISPDSVKKAKNRLRKKLELPVEHDLIDFLKEVELKI